MAIDQSLKIKPEGYGIDKIADGIYKVNDYNLSTMFVINGETSSVVIDTGTGVGDFKAVADRLTEGRPYKVILTHGHTDHAGGRGQFGAIAVSEQDLALAKKASVAMRKGYIFIVKRFMGFRTISRKKAVIKKSAEPEYEIIKEGDVFDLGGRHIRVFAAPGHTKGSLVFLAEEDRILFSGDTLNTNMLMFLSESTSIEDYVKTLEKLEGLAPLYDTVWASHLSAAITLAERDEIKKCACEILERNKRNSLLPVIAFARCGTTVIIHRKSRIRNKKHS